MGLYCENWQLESYGGTGCYRELGMELLVMLVFERLWWEMLCPGRLVEVPSGWELVWIVWPPSFYATLNSYLDSSHLFSAGNAVPQRLIPVAAADSLV